MDIKRVCLPDQSRGTKRIRVITRAPRASTFTQERDVSTFAHIFYE